MTTSSDTRAEALDVDTLAQEIRRVDGNHTMGAGALAEALLPFIRQALQQEDAPAPDACSEDNFGRNAFQWLDNWYFWNRKRIGHWASIAGSDECQAFLCGDKLGYFPNLIEAEKAVEASAREWLSSALTKPEGEQEPVGEAGTMPGSSGFTMAAFEAAKVPVGTKLYASAPPLKEAQDSAEAIWQEPKYQFENGRVVNRASGDVIPQDEPVMVFRARDRYAAHTIGIYATMCQDEAHRAIVVQRFEQFRDFASEHPDRMKEPDTAVPAAPAQRG